MEYLFSKIKKMDVVCISDGRNMGKIFDVAFEYPSGGIKGFFVTGSKGFKLTKGDEFVPLYDVVKIGEDVVLIKAAGGKGGDCKGEGDKLPCAPPCPPPRRSYEEYE